MVLYDYLLLLWVQSFGYNKAKLVACLCFHTAYTFLIPCTMGLYKIIKLSLQLRNGLNAGFLRKNQ